MTLKCQCGFLLLHTAVQEAVGILLLGFDLSLTVCSLSNYHNNASASWGAEGVKSMVAKLVVKLFYFSHSSSHMLPCPTANGYNFEI